MTATKRQHTGVTQCAWPTHAASNRRRPPPAFYGVPPAPGGSDLERETSTHQAAVSVSPQNIRSGMQVYDYDGVYVGRVTDVRATSLRVRRHWRADLRVPLDQVLAVLDQHVVLTVPRQQAHVA